MVTTRSVMMPPVRVRRTGPVAEPTVMVVPTVGHVIVDMESGRGAAFHRAQRKAGPRAIPAFMVVPAVNHAIVHMTARKGTALNRTNGDHGLPRLCMPPVATAFPMPAAMGGCGNGQQVNGHDTRQGG